MNMKLLRGIPLAVCVAALSCATGCGSSNPNETSITLANGVQLEMVRLPNNLWFGKYEVTQAQWKAVLDGSPSRFKLTAETWSKRGPEAFKDGNPSEFKGPDNPVEKVSWVDCQEFLKMLNALPSVKESGLTFRLPTEEEWEFACRAGATGDYCKLADGSEITERTLGRVAWFEDNSDDTTHPVGRKKPNAWGLYDMHGNVWEWTSTAAGVFSFRVIRGGSWQSSAEHCKSSLRSESSPTLWLDTLGFRLCAEGGAD